MLIFRNFVRQFLLIVGRVLGLIAARARATSRRSIAISVLTGSLLFICLPPPELYYAPTNIVIEALGTRNEKAKSTEVWIGSFGTGHHPVPLAGMFGLPLGWERRGAVLVSYRDQPARLTWAGRIEPGTRLIFSKHHYSGNVRLAIDGATTDIDLYSAEPATHSVEIAMPATDATPSLDLDRLGQAIVSLALLVLFSHLLIMAAQRTAASIARMEKSPGTAMVFPPGTGRLGLWLAVPSIISFTVVLLIFWPGQMSPDSIDQWREAIRWSLTDAHTVFHTGFIRLMSWIWRSPTSPIAAQALLVALGTGMVLAELRNWRVPTPILVVTSIGIALWPMNFLIATTLWKDVLFTAGTLFLLQAMLILVRVRGVAFQSVGFCILLVAATLVVSLTRHNMLPFALLLPAGLIVCYRDQPWSRLLPVIAPMLLVPLLLKLVILPAWQIPSLGLHYRAINAIHVIGAYVRAGKVTAEADVALAERVMPLEVWNKAYDCETVDRLFFDRQVNRGALAEGYGQINRLALSLIASSPGTFLAHQACTTNMLWKVLPRAPNLIGFPPLDVTPMPFATEIGLALRPILPSLTDPMRNLRFWSASGLWISLFWRPAIHLFVLSLMVITLMATLRRWDFGLLALPAWLNTATLALLMGAPDSRYQYSVVMACLVLLPLLLVRSGKTAKS